MEKKMVELFAGVGGFRLGFDRLQSGWETVWFSQWEPGKKVQFAHDCYVRHFGDSKNLKGEYETNEDIARVEKKDIPDHTLLVGGFPCQDYSVAHSLATSKGIEGKKGVLWWEIYNTILEKKPAFCLFENVDRLLKSPAKQRGRDFGMILACLNEQGYNVEWRVINAAQYGAAQRRKRTFIFAYKQDTQFAKTQSQIDELNVINKKGFFAQGFPIEQAEKLDCIEIGTDLVEVSDKFAYPFENAGYMKNGMIYSTKVVEVEEEPITLGQILECDVDDEYYFTTDELRDWAYLKGSKKIERTSNTGHKYTFSEGPIAFPDSWDKPGRTMLTSEGTKNRSTHVVADPTTGRIRRLTPIEAERLQGFDDNWTEGMTERQRYFCMGNALVVPMITRMGNVLDKIIETE